MSNYYENEIGAVKAAVKALDDKFAQDITVLDIGAITPIADFFIIATGTNPNQMRAMSDAAEEVLAKNGCILKHSEGTSNWILLDCGAVVVHLFDKESREFYNLERIWGDAARVDISGFIGGR